jgi:hypothetical protein
MYVTTNPPNGMIAGDPVHIALVWSPLVLTLMAVLSGLGRGINKSYESVDFKGNTKTVTEEGGFGWKVPDWMKNMSSGNYSESQKRARQSQSLDEYRKTVHSAFYRLDENGKRKK